MSTTDHLGNMDLVVADKYKYQGQIMNHKSNLADHLQMIKNIRKQKQIPKDTTTGSAKFYESETEVIWKTLSPNLILIVTYSGAVWKTKKRIN